MLLQTQSKLLKNHHEPHLPHPSQSRLKRGTTTYTDTTTTSIKVKIKTKRQRTKERLDQHPSLIETSKNVEHNQKKVENQKNEFVHDVTKPFHQQHEEMLNEWKHRRNWNENDPKKEKTNFKEIDAFVDFSATHENEFT